MQKKPVTLSLPQGSLESKIIGFAGKGSNPNQYVFDFQDKGCNYSAMVVLTEGYRKPIISLLQVNPMIGTALLLRSDGSGLTGFTGDYNGTEFPIERGHLSTYLARKGKLIKDCEYLFKTLSYKICNLKDDSYTESGQPKGIDYTGSSGEYTMSN
jgi:hypothetical protein